MSVASIAREIQAETMAAAESGARRGFSERFIIRKSERAYPVNPETVRQMDARRRIEMKREAEALGLTVEDLYGGAE